MEGKEISDKKEVENKISPEKEQTVLLPLYTKSYSQTLIESFIFEFTWEIDQFLNLSKCIDTLCSPLFPETAEYKIQMNVYRRKDSQLIETIVFHLLTTKAFTGLCSTTIMFPGEQFFSSNSTSCHTTSNSTLLIKIKDDDYKYYKYTCTDRLKLHCKLEIFYKLTSDTTHMNLQPSSTVFSKDIRSLEDSILDKSNKLEDKKSINFIIGNETYIISKKLLHATNSSYFKNICLTHKGEEKDMTNELTNERKTFQEMLAFIQTGSNKLSKSNYEDNMLKSLLTTADKYDVPALKLTCEHYLLRYVTVDNAPELVQLAFSSNAKFLETHLVTFIKFHFKEFMNTTQLNHLSQENLNKILELIEKCKVSEITDEFLSPAYKE